MKFFLAQTENLNLFTYAKNHVVLLLDHFKYWRDLFSLEILKNAPTYDNVLGGWYIYQQPAIVVFRVGLHQQLLSIFFATGTGTRGTPLNKRTELVSKCRHRNKFLLSNIK